MRRLAFVFAGLALVGAAPVAALPPAPEVAVLVYAPWGGNGEFDEALLARIAPDDGGGWFRRTQPAFTSADFEPCGSTGIDSEACVRTVLAGRGAAGMEGPPTVVVLIRPAPGFHVGWTCIGVGDGPGREERQRSPDIQRVPGAEDRNAQAAASCILGAAAESGW